MSNQLVKIRFHGFLAAELGRSEWAFAVSSPTEALQAVEANTGKMLDILYANWNADYFVAINGKPVRDIQEMSVMQRSDLTSIEFFPAFKGAGDMSGWMILAGVLLIALVIVAPYIGPVMANTATTSLAGAVGIGTTAGTIILGLGMSLLFSGIAGLLAPTQKFDSAEKPENIPSYIFNGALNTYRQGNPIPVGFGRLIVGSQVVSAGVRAVDVDTSNV